VTSERDPRGKWRPGHSGNRRGRPVGRGRVHQLRAMIDAEVPAVLEAVIGKALQGDTTCARLVLEAEAVDLPVDGSLTDKGKAVLDATAAGRLSPQQAQQWLAALSDLGRLVELHELVERVRQLEEAHERRTESQD
jgi:hypothetical protein